MFMFENVISPAIDSVVSSKLLPRSDMTHPFLRCSIPWIGANEGSGDPDTIDCDISLNKQVLGETYNGDLKSGLVWIFNGQKEVGLKIVWILNGFCTPEAQPFELRTNGHHFVKHHLKSGQKCPDFEWSSFQMVGTIAIAKAWPFANQTI